MDQRECSDSKNLSLRKKVDLKAFCLRYLKDKNNSQKPSKSQHVKCTCKEDKGNIFKFKSLL
jgi:hypothetical protein